MKIKFFFIIFIFLPVLAYAQMNPTLRHMVMERTLDEVEANRHFSPSAGKNLYVQKVQEKRPATKKQATISKKDIPQEENQFLKELKEDIRSAFGEKAYATFGLQTGYIKGNTTYHISFSEAIIYKGESELEFPLDNFLLGIEGGLGYKNINNEKQDRARLTVSWLTDITNDAGKMKDSDWLNDNYDIYYYGIAHPGLDIYSESDADLDTNIVDVNYTFNFCPTKNISIGPMVGYKYQKFEYDISNTNQVGYGPYAGDYTAFVSGKTLTYEVKYHIPYLGLSTDLLLGDKFQLNLRFGYSPWAGAEDRDDHLLRYKLSTANCDGDAYLINLNASWKFLPAWILQAGGEYVDIDTDGTQHQSYYAGPYVGLTADVDDKITSEYWLVDVAIKYIF